MTCHSYIYIYLHYFPQWTWDPEKGGESVTIVEEGMKASLVEANNDVGGKWEYNFSTRTGYQGWEDCAPELNAQIEKLYKKGQLYKRSSNHLKTFIVQTRQVEIGSYYVNGFIGHFLTLGKQCYLRRKGERLSVPGEERFLSEEQKNRDITSAHWRKQAEEWRRKKKEERYGKDIEAIRGSIGILQKQGVHKWTIQWNHEPARGGRGDGIGMCSDYFETFGPCALPCLGSAADSSSSFALYANGECILDEPKRLYYLNADIFDLKLQHRRILLRGKAPQGCGRQKKSRRRFFGDTRPALRQGLPRGMRIRYD